MIVFGYAKDIAPISSIGLHIYHFRQHPKVELKQHQARHEINRRYKQQTYIMPLGESFLCNQRQFATSRIFVTFLLKTVETRIRSYVLAQLEFFSVYFPSRSCNERSELAANGFRQLPVLWKQLLNAACIHDFLKC